MITHYYHIKISVDFWCKRWIEPPFNLDNDIKFPTRFVARDYKKIFKKKEKKRNQPPSLCVAVETRDWNSVEDHVTC